MILILCAFILFRSLIYNLLGDADKGLCIHADSAREVKERFLREGIDVKIITSDMSLKDIKNLAKKSNSAALLYDISGMDYSNSKNKYRIDSFLDMASCAGQQGGKGYYGTPLIITNSKLPHEISKRCFHFFADDIKDEMTNSFLDMLPHSEKELQEAIERAKGMKVEQFSDFAKHLACATAFLRIDNDDLLDIISEMDVLNEKCVNSQASVWELWSHIIHFFIGMKKAGKLQVFELPEIPEEAIETLDSVIFLAEDRFFISSEYFSKIYSTLDADLSIKRVKSILAAESILDTDVDGKIRSWMTYRKADGKSGRIRMICVRHTNVHYARSESVDGILRGGECYVK